MNYFDVSYLFLIGICYLYQAIVMWENSNPVLIM